MTLTYLASPYSHQDPEVRLQRFNLACREAAEMMMAGQMVFSPIAHIHPIALAGNLPLGFDYWETYDRRMIEACDEVHVLLLPGWKDSKGVTAEIAIAKELGRKVTYVFPQ